MDSSICGSRLSSLAPTHGISHSFHHYACGELGTTLSPDCTSLQSRRKQLLAVKSLPALGLPLPHPGAPTVRKPLGWGSAPPTACVSHDQTWQCTGSPTLPPCGLHHLCWPESTVYHNPKGMEEWFTLYQPPLNHRPPQL